MNQKVLRYIIVAFVCAMLFNMIPNEKNPIKDMWMFVSFGVLLYYTYENSNIKSFVISEQFDNSNNIVNTDTTKVDTSNNTVEKSVIELPSSNTLKNLSEKINELKKIKEERILEEQKAIQERDVELEKIRKEMAELDAIKAEKQKLLTSKLSNEMKDGDSCDCNKKLENVLIKYLSAGKYIDEHGLVQNLLESDMKYNQLDPTLLQPLGSYDKTFTNKWNHGFTYLSTDKWAAPLRQTGPCKVEKQCPVCPVATAGYPTNLMEFDESRKALPPDNISIDYIKEKLNA